MADLNKVFLIGNLTRDPELRYTPQGSAVATLRIAANRRFRDKSGEIKKDACFVNVVVWGNLAEVCNQYLQKGKSVFVEGNLQSRSWQDQEGKNRSTIEVRAERVQFLSPRESVPEVDLGPSPAEEESTGEISSGEN
ncbi:MAG: single-stranded DNA-binding protein [Candidatus Omnitrophica bacterium]|nr:single-stranded DNA-binding protein [Candidatus Omnitrophota bacterium]